MGGAPSSTASPAGTDTERQLSMRECGLQRAELWKKVKMAYYGRPTPRGRGLAGVAACIPRATHPHWRRPPRPSASLLGSNGSGAHTRRCSSVQAAARIRVAARRQQRRHWRRRASASLQAWQHTASARMQLRVYRPRRCDACAYACVHTRSRHHATTLSRV